MIKYAEGVRYKILEDAEVALHAMNNISIDQFTNGKIRQAIPGAIVGIFECKKENDPSGDG